jgi:hypothetical protein
MALLLLFTHTITSTLVGISLIGYMYASVTTTPACCFAQPEHHRFVRSDSGPKLGCFTPQPSHILVLAFTTPECDFAQPEHHRFVRTRPRLVFTCTLTIVDVLSRCCDHPKPGKHRLAGLG